MINLLPGQKFLFSCIRSWKDRLPQVSDSQPFQLINCPARPRQQLGTRIYLGENSTKILRGLRIKTFERRGLKDVIALIERDLRLEAAKMNIDLRGK